MAARRAPGAPAAASWARPSRCQRPVRDDAAPDRGPPIPMSSASGWTASALASRPTWTRCRSSARPSRCGTVNGTCTSAPRCRFRRRWPSSSTTMTGWATFSRPAGSSGESWYRLMIAGHDDPLITAEPRLRRIEQGNFAQRALRRGYYPLMLRTRCATRWSSSAGRASSARTTRSRSRRNCAAGATTVSTSGRSRTGRCPRRTAPGPCSPAPRTTSRPWAGRGT